MVTRESVTAEPGQQKRHRSQIRARSTSHRSSTCSQSHPRGPRTIPGLAGRDLRVDREDPEKERRRDRDRQGKARVQVRTVPSRDSARHQGKDRVRRRSLALLRGVRTRPGSPTVLGGPLSGSLSRWSPR